MPYDEHMRGEVAPSTGKVSGMNRQLGNWWPFGRKPSASAQDSHAPSHPTEVGLASPEPSQSEGETLRALELDFARQVQEEGPLREVCGQITRLMQDATALYREDRRELAIQRFTSALELLGPLAVGHPEVWDIKYILIRCYEAVDPERMIAIGHEALDLLLRWGNGDGADEVRDPHLFTLCRKLYKQLLIKGRFEEAIPCLNGVLETADRVHATDPNVMILVERDCARFFLEQIRAGNRIDGLLELMALNGPEPSIHLIPGRSESEDALIEHLEAIAASVS